MTKYWKTILFMTFLVMSFSVLYKDNNDIFSFYSFFAFPLASIIILIFAFIDYRNKSIISVFPFLGMMMGVFLYFGNETFLDFKWQRELNQIMQAIETHYKNNNQYPDGLENLPIKLSKLAQKKHLRYFVGNESKYFVLEYNEGFSTVYNYNSERSTWENYVEWAGG